MAKDGNRVKPVDGGDRYNPYFCPSDPEVRKHFADGVRKKFEAGYDLVQLEQSDGYFPCHCPRCKALGEGYETEQVHVCHDAVMREVLRSHPDKKILLGIYGPTAVPSRIVKQYPSNAVLEVASEDEGEIRRWGAVAPNGVTVYVYYFGVYKNLGLAPKAKSPRYMAESIKMLHRVGVRGIYWCGGAENWGGEGPVYYVIGRLMNDPGLEWEPLVREYCNLVFGKAGPTMFQFYTAFYSRMCEADGLPLNESLVQMWPVAVLRKCERLLAKARNEAAGDPRALNWLRAVDYSFRQVQLMAKVAHIFPAYQFNKTPENMKQIEGAVTEYRSFVAEVLALEKKEPDFVRNYFPAYGIYWKKVDTNYDKLREPFIWTFNDALNRARVEKQIE